ncbi:hypothetical protein AVEN_216792-1, partial [Araneus ventricosus]
ASVILCFCLKLVLGIEFFNWFSVFEVCGEKYWIVNFCGSDQNCQTHLTSCKMGEVVSETVNGVNLASLTTEESLYKLVSMPFS